MSKILVLYKSKYGATKKYADMLKEELSCDVLDTDDYKTAPLENYDCIIFAGGLYAIGIAGIKILQRNYAKIKDKNIAVFCVGASPFDEKAMEEIKKHNLKEELKNIPLFYGRGAWDESKMNFKDRMLCKMLHKAVSKADPASYEPWMKALLSSTGEKCDWTDKEFLTPLLNYVNENS